jgi:hypothetical protein
MAPPPRRLRSAGDLKTQAGIAGAAAKPTTRHAIALKIAMLEIERARRTKESLTASARARGVLARLREIEEECMRLQKSFADLGPEPPRPSAKEGSTRTAPSPDGVSTPHRRALRY